MNCDIKEGETITVDIEKRKVTSDIRGNMITFLADDAHITDFKIDTGISTLSITATNIEGVLVASCIFSNRYLYALI